MPKATASKQGGGDSGRPKLQRIEIEFVPDHCVAEQVSIQLRSFSNAFFSGTVTNSSN